MYVGRRWAATYIFHMGQIQLARKGRDGKIQQLTARKNPTIRHTRLQNAMQLIPLKTYRAGYFN